MILIKIKPIIILRGILWGALFFCSCLISAQNSSSGNDIETAQDTSRLMRSRIRQTNNAEEDTISQSIDSDEAFLIKHDTIYVVNDSSFVHSDSLSVQNDTVILIGDSLTIVDESSVYKNKRGREHSPPRATILSAVVPGLGQAYNRKYWKIPLIYGAGVGLYLYFDWTNERFNYWNDIYENELAKGAEGNQDTIDNAILNRDTASKRRGYAVIFMGILYVANVVDAMVDAHFLKFNVSDDLSMQIEPDISPIPSQFAFDSFSYGVTLSLNF